MSTQQESFLYKSVRDELPTRRPNGNLGSPWEMPTASSGSLGITSFDSPSLLCVWLSFTVTMVNLWGV